MRQKIQEWTSRAKNNSVNPYLHHHLLTLQYIIVYTGYKFNVKLETLDSHFQACIYIKVGYLIIVNHVGKKIIFKSMRGKA